MPKDSSLVTTADTAHIKPKGKELADCTPGKLIEYTDTNGNNIASVIISCLSDKGHCAIRELTSLEVVFADYSKDSKSETWHFLK